MKKPFDIESFKSLILEIENEKEHYKHKSKEISLLENKNENLQMINEEVNLLLKLFKEFSFYSARVGEGRGKGGGRGRGWKGKGGGGGGGGIVCFVGGGVVVFVCCGWVRT